MSSKHIVQYPFCVVENVLTDGSIVWEIRQEGSDQRLASAATEDEAKELEMTLNLAVTDWSERTAQNTVDC